MIVVNGSGCDKVNIADNCFISYYIGFVHFLYKKRTDFHDFRTIFSLIYVKCLFCGVTWTYA